MQVRRIKLTVTADGSGAADATSEVFSGQILQIQYVKNNYADTVDFTITLNESGQSVWSQANVTASVIKAVRQPTYNQDGTAALYAAAGSPVNDLIPVWNDKLRVVLAQAGASTTGVFYVYVLGG